MRVECHAADEKELHEQGNFEALPGNSACLKSRYSFETSSGNHLSIKQLENSEGSWAGNQLA
jgi:hypothetical protein